jgi:hypothetical protein
MPARPTLSCAASTHTSTPPTYRLTSGSGARRSSAAPPHERERAKGLRAEAERQFLALLEQHDARLPSAAQVLN